LTEDRPLASNARCRSRRSRRRDAVPRLVGAVPLPSLIARCPRGVVRVVASRRFCRHRRVVTNESKCEFDCVVVAPQYMCKQCGIRPISAL
jgi:hypothetical protein